MRWPWTREPPRVERREALPFTDAVVAALAAQAAGHSVGDPGSIAALELAATLYSRALQAAAVSPGPAAAILAPGTLALIARNLIRRGEDVHLLRIERGRLQLQAIGSWDVRGGPREATWWYRVDEFGPSGNQTHFVPSAAVLHCRYAVDPARPWYGIGPLGWARATGTLAANLEQRLGEEAGGPVGHVIPLPQDGGDGGEDDPLAGFKADLAGAKGKTVLTETTAAGWGEGKLAAPQADYKPQRFGANPPAALPTLRSEAALAALAATGVPVSLATDADGTSQREAWRRFVMGAVEPFAAAIAAECEAKLELPVRFDLSRLWAHDLAGRAQAFQRMIAGGMALDRAVQVSGLAAEMG